MSESEAIRWMEVLHGRRERESNPQDSKGSGFNSVTESIVYVLRDLSSSKVTHERPSL
jgi:hypothetical protein